MRTDIFRKGVHIVVFAWFCLCCIPLKAQVETQLPDGFGTGGLQTTENLSSGVLNFSLPIENAVVPVSIGYVTTGIRVSQRPTEVGLGWNLQVGGFISRQKRGKADDDDNGYSGTNLRGNNLSTILSNANHYNDFYKNNYDAQPDIFQYSFLGQSGKFVIDTNREVIHLTPSTLKIVPVFSASFGYHQFDVWDAQGNKYVFNVREGIDIRELDENDNQINNSSYNEAYTYKWHLKTITDYRTGDVTNFSYSPRYSSQISQYTENNIHTTRYMIGSNVHDTDTKRIRTLYRRPLVIAITRGNYRLNFIHGSRADLPSTRKLNRIEYFFNNQTILEYQFDYKYLGTSQKRLMLAGVSKSSLDVSLYQFVYFGEEPGEDVLPSFTSKSQDHWGFYNTNNYSTLFGSANRRPNLARTRANTLKKIIHTTGGVEEFEYELNSYMHDHDNNVLTAKIEQNVGGLRIKSITNKAVDNSGNNVVKNYTYDDFYADYTTKHPTSGVVFNEPLMTYDYVVEGGSSFLVESEFSHKRLSDPNGSHIAYKYVKVKNLDGSYTINQFKTFDDRAELHTSEYFTRGVRAITTSGSNKSWKSPKYFLSLFHPAPFAPLNESGQFVGLPVKTLNFDRLNNLVGSQNYTYTKKQASKTLQGYSLLPMASLQGSKKVRQIFYQGYELSNSYLQLSETRSGVKPINTTSRHETTTTYTYDADYPLVTKEESLFKRYLYSGNFNVSVYEDLENKSRVEREYLFRKPGYSTAVNQNLLSLIGSEEAYKNNELLSKSVNTYTLSNGKYILSQARGYRGAVLTSDSRYEYENGLLLESYDALSGKSNSIVYDELRRPIADISNARHETVAYTGFESQDDLGNWTFSTSSLGNYDGRVGKGYRLYVGQVSFTVQSGIGHTLSFWRKGGNVSRSGMSGAQLVQSYAEGNWIYEEWTFTGAGQLALYSNSSSVYIDELRLYEQGGTVSTTNYHSLFGVSAEADHNNNVVKYSYDAAGRRVLVEDQHNNVLEQTEYNIAEYIFLSKRNNYVGYLEGAQVVDVTSNASWTVSGLPNWITTTTSSGSNQGTVELNIARNNNTSSGRTADITFTTSNGISKVLTITQTAGVAPYLTVSSTTISLTNGVTSAPILVQSNVSWTATITLGSGDILLQYDFPLRTGESYSSTLNDSFEVVSSGLAGPSLGGPGSGSATHTGQITISAPNIPSRTITVYYTINSSNQQQ